MYWLHPSSKSLGIFSPFHPLLCIFLYFNSNILSLLHFLYFLIKLSFFYLSSFIRLFFLYLLTSHSLIHHYICFLLPAIFSSTLLLLSSFPLSTHYSFLLSVYMLFLFVLYSHSFSLSHTSVFSIIPISLLLFLLFPPSTLTLCSYLLSSYLPRPSASSISNYLFSLVFFFFIFDNLYVTAPFSLLIFFLFLSALISLSPFSSFFSLIFLSFLFLALQPTVGAP
ncbi:unnamed protein product [Acanthosepion pharaonis]|uniref:Uncharacterized protein n=1 Tax=Acanthosepion pharaonis TaxID=158019 RepID=A0A812AK66_ACAPH|nr:unnamed protein product [Sepia pharaonis]